MYRHEISSWPADFSVGDSDFLAERKRESDPTFRSFNARFTKNFEDLDISKKLFFEM